MVSGLILGLILTTLTLTGGGGNGIFAFALPAGRPAAIEPPP